MTDKELRKLNRLELLEVMVTQSKEMEALQKQLDNAYKEIGDKNFRLEEAMVQLVEIKDQLKVKDSQLDTITVHLADVNQQLEIVTSQLDNRQMANGQTETMAEAAHQLNGVFDAAQNAVEQYLDDIAKLRQHEAEASLEREKESKRKAQQLLQETMDKCAALERETQEKCRLQEEITKKKCDDALKLTKEKIDKYWYQLLQRRENFYHSNPNLKKSAMNVKSLFEEEAGEEAE